MYWTQTTGFNSLLLVFNFNVAMNLSYGRTFTNWNIHQMFLCLWILPLLTWIQAKTQAGHSKQLNFESTDLGLDLKNMHFISFWSYLTLVFQTHSPLKKRKKAHNNKFWVETFWDVNESFKVFWISSCSFLLLKNVYWLWSEFAKMKKKKKFWSSWKTFCLSLDYLYLIFLHLLSNQNQFKYVQLYSADAGFRSGGR